MAADESEVERLQRAARLLMTSSVDVTFPWEEGMMADVFGDAKIVPSLDLLTAVPLAMRAGPLL
eukprot:2768072-Amphidinium_carterae.1